jgi:TPR repeat protein
MQQRGAPAFLPALLLLIAQPVAAACGTGAQLTNISNTLRQQENIPSYLAGALVRVVRPNSPASRAGLRPGDVIQAVGGDLIQNVCDYRSTIEKFGCGLVRLTVRRDDATLAFDVRLAEIPAGRFDDQQRCRSGDGAACTALARATGDSVDLLRLACDLGDADGCFLLGVKLGNNKEGAAAYESACDGGNALACTNLGWMYERGAGVTKDGDAAVRLFRRGCRGTICTGPNNLGCLNLARLLRDGTILPRDDREALRILRDLCDRRPKDTEDAEHLARACSLAGITILFGKDMVRDVNAALELLEKGCDAGDPFGCFNLGSIYDNGTDVPEDTPRAKRYYTRACASGDAEACSVLTSRRMQ